MEKERTERESEREELEIALNREKVLREKAEYDLGSERDMSFSLKQKLREMEHQI